MAHVVKPDSVSAGIKTELEILFASYSIQVLSLEIQSPVAPNWFGVSFRKGINRFDTVNIFFHPFPQGAGMDDADYPAHSGSWSRLFRYTQMLGRQMSIAKSNHVTLIPFFSNASYGSGGIFTPNWIDIADQALALARQAASSSSSPSSGGAHTIEFSAATRKKGTPAPQAPPAHAGSLKHVILSCFSRGQAPMSSFRSSAPNLGSFLRETWDFDGVGGTRGGFGRSIRYDQGKADAKIPLLFHVPPERWVKYHNSIVKNVHGDIPAMLATHAASISVVGK